MTKPHLFCVLLGLRLNLVRCKSTSGEKLCGGGASVDAPGWDAALAPSVCFASFALLIQEIRPRTSTLSAFLFVITNVFTPNPHYWLWQRLGGTPPHTHTHLPHPSSMWRFCQKCAHKRRHQVSIIIKLNFNNFQLYCTILNISHKSAREALVLSKGRIIHLFSWWLMNSMAKQREAKVPL